MRRLLKGFTLIELLIVCSIIAILASISAVNYMEAQTRAKTARVKADMFAMSTAVEAYAVDCNSYPIRHHRWKRGVLLDPEAKGEEDLMWHHAPLVEKLFDPAAAEARVGLHVLTTPIAYLSCLPRDPFNVPVRSLIKEKVIQYGYG